MWCRRCLFPLGSPDGVSLVEWVEHNQLRGGGGGGGGDMRKEHVNQVWGYSVW